MRLAGDATDSSLIIVPYIGFTSAGKPPMLSWYAGLPQTFDVTIASISETAKADGLK